MKNLDFKVVDSDGKDIPESAAPMLDAGLQWTIELPDDEKLNVEVKMLHSNNLKATAYNVQQHICAFLEWHCRKGWICTQLFHVPQFPNEPVPEVTVIYVNNQPSGHDNPRPQPDPPPV